MHFKNYINSTLFGSSLWLIDFICGLGSRGVSGWLENCLEPVVYCFELFFFFCFFFLLCFPCYYFVFYVHVSYTDCAPGTCPLTSKTTSVQRYTFYFIFLRVKKSFHNHPDILFLMIQMILTVL